VIGWSIAVGRLRSYERECRRQAAAAQDGETRDELIKLGDSFRRAIEERQASIEDLPARPF
jgi:hypothetical protein